MDLIGRKKQHLENLVEGSQKEKIDVVNLQDRIFNRKIFQYVNPIILGIDPSLKNTAVYVSNGNGYHDLHKRMFKLETEKGDRVHEYDLRERVEKISFGFRDVLNELTAVHLKIADSNWQGDRNFIAIIEDYAFSRGGFNFGRVFDLAEVGGAIKHILFEYAINFIVVTPTQLKKFVTGNGKAKKGDMLNAVKNEIVTKDDNIADAYGLWKIGMCLFNRSLIKNSIQKKIISDIRKKLED